MALIEFFTKLKPTLSSWASTAGVRKKSWNASQPHNDNFDKYNVYTTGLRTSSLFRVRPLKVVANLLENKKNKTSLWLLMIKKIQFSPVIYRKEYVKSYWLKYTEYSGDRRAKVQATWLTGSLPPMACIQNLWSSSDRACTVSTVPGLDRDTPHQH